MAQQTRIISITAFTALAFLTLPLAEPAIAQRAAQPVANFYVTVGATDNPTCDQTHPCTPQGAVMACQAQWIYLCGIYLAPGVYLDPGIDVYHFKFMQFFGNVTITNGHVTCNNASSVVFRATQSSSTVIQGQDHSTVSAWCLTIDGTASLTGASGISTRNHVIADFIDVIFSLPANNWHVQLTGLSIGHCISNVTIAGGGPLRSYVDGTSFMLMACSVH